MIVGIILLWVFLAAGMIAVNRRLRSHEAAILALAKALQLMAESHPHGRDSTYDH